MNEQEMTTLLAQREEWAVMVNGLKQSLVNEGWHEHNAEKAVIACLMSGGAK